MLSKWMAKNVGLCMAFSLAITLWSIVGLCYRQRVEWFAVFVTGALGLLLMVRRYGWKPMGLFHSYWITQALFGCVLMVLGHDLTYTQWSLVVGGGIGGIAGTGFAWFWHSPSDTDQQVKPPVNTVGQQDWQI